MISKSSAVLQFSSSSKVWYCSRHNCFSSHTWYLITFESCWRCSIFSSAILAFTEAMVHSLRAVFLSFSRLYRYQNFSIITCRRKAVHTLAKARLTLFVEIETYYGRTSHLTERLPGWASTAPQTCPSSEDMVKESSTSCSRLSSTERVEDDGPGHETKTQSDRRHSYGAFGPIDSCSDRAGAYLVPRGDWVAGTLCLQNEMACSHQRPWAERDRLNSSTLRHTSRSMLTLSFHQIPHRPLLIRVLL